MTKDFGGFNLSFDDSNKNDLNFQVSDEVAGQVQTWLETPFVDPNVQGFGENCT